MSPQKKKKPWGQFRRCKNRGGNNCRCKKTLEAITVAAKTVEAVLSLQSLPSPCKTVCRFSSCKSKAAAERCKCATANTATAKNTGHQTALHAEVDTISRSFILTLCHRHIVRFHVQDESILHTTQKRDDNTLSYSFVLTSYHNPRRG